ncbi:MAG: glycoside hydrolase family protein [Proteobacteria bacterium]|nr:glycoside hydrolase family protein [Pseudomonadota bacterium]
MISVEESVQRLSLHEGIRLQPYRCPAGYLTIGVGRNLETNPISAEEERVVGDWRSGITKEAAFYLLRHDINRVTAECRERIPFWKELDDERQYALLDMAFNLGVAGLLKFKKMLAYLGVGNYRQAAVECLASKYAKDTGRRAERIAETIRTGRFII